MSILAEPRRKQRLSVDPRNLQWRNDGNNYSKRLMERMGWSEGEGLGRNGQGIVEHLKLQANTSGRGLGANNFTTHDGTWIKHHDDFADLLNSLNKVKEQDHAEDRNKEMSEKTSLESTSKSTRRRIHYQKFTRAKDISKYSKNDLSAVTGVGIGKPIVDDSIKSTPIDKTKKNNLFETSFESNTTVSRMSVGGYFAAKMLAMKAVSHKTESQPEVHIEEQIGVEERTAERGRLKRKKKLKFMKESQLEIQAEVERGDEESRIPTTKGKRLGKRTKKCEG